MNSPFLPYGRQVIDDSDIEAVARVLRSDYLTTGPLVDEYEHEFALATSANHAVACNSGTAALHLAALGLDLSPGQAVVVPTVTFLATANVVRMTGAEVIFADVDAQTGLMESAHLEQSLKLASEQGFKVAAAAPVHLNGQLCDMAALAEVASAHDVVLFEDSCHALGGEAVGACPHSMMACFSTHPVKAIATGEGGVVTTNDAELAARLRRLRSHGMERDNANFQFADKAMTGSDVNSWYYDMSEIGWNYRLPDILCALGLSQLQRLREFRQQRIRLASLYDELLSPLDWIGPAGRHPDRGHGWHLYAVLIDFENLKMNRQFLMQQLRENGVGSQVHYIPVHWQPYYRERYGAAHLPGADEYYQRCLSLPLYPTMSEDDVHRVVDALVMISHQEC